MAIVQYTISNGIPNFVVELSPSIDIPNNIHSEVGTYQFNDVPDGDYELIIIDGNNCVYNQSITVNQLVSTTTTTVIPNNSIIVGNTDDIMLIFNENATNRTDHYVGYLNDNQVTLYLWLKTRNGAPLGVNKEINYTITSAYSTDSTINYVDHNNKNNVFITEDNNDDDSVIGGQIILEPGFIETYLMYNIVNVSATPEFQITLDSSIEVFDTTISPINDVQIYGITSIDDKNLIMNF